jgi:hypothetical protein
MRRRDLILSSAGLAGAVLPNFAGAAKPCPPPQVMLQGGGSATTSCGIGSKTYSTNFPNSENPISEGGVWRNTGLDWTKVATSGGLAFSTQTRDDYDDSYAFLNGFGPDQSASATIHLASGYRAGGSHEVEIILRCSDSPHSISWYECNLAWDGGYTQIMLLNGPKGTFQEVTHWANRIAPRDGDVFSASAIGNAITVYLNGVMIANATDSTLPMGQPGMAFFIRPGAVARNYCFSSFSAVG